MKERGFIMGVGIDKIAFHVPPYYIDMTDLAHAREVDPNKFLIGIGQEKMAVMPVSQDIVTLGATAAAKILTEEDKQTIDMVIVGTETGIDYSKSSAVTIRQLLGIQPFTRAYEIKQACYGATAALQQAVEYVKNRQERKVLVIAADVAKYGLASGGEPTQGAGAVAMLVSQQPRILELQNDSVFFSEDAYDFWRPNGHDYPLVNGHLSNEVYIHHFQTVWTQNKKHNHLAESDYAALCFHIPYTKMGKKALLSIFPEMLESEQERLMARYEESTVYSRQVGNLYTGSLYLGLISLLKNSEVLHAGDRIGLFSYGSGAVSEFFSGKLVEGYKAQLEEVQHNELLTSRQQLTVAEYEEKFEQRLPQDGSSVEFDDPAIFSITKVEEGIRYYRQK